MDLDHDSVDGGGEEGLAGVGGVDDEGSDGAADMDARPAAGDVTEDGGEAVSPSSLSSVLNFPLFRKL